MLGLNVAVRVPLASLAMPTNVAQTLAAFTSGSHAAGETLLPVIYDELRRLAARHLSRERADHTLQPTALVHEAYLRLLPSGAPDAERSQFLGLASQAMRRVLVDHARHRNRQKRGGGLRKLTLDEALTPALSLPDCHELDLALKKLEGEHERMARVVELRFFGGLTLPEIAEVIGVSRTTAAADWAFARTWLHRELADEADGA